MLVATAPLSIAQFETEVDAIFDSAEAPATLDSPADYEVSIKPPEPTAISPELESKPLELSEEDKAERLWWDKVEILGKIKDCSRMKQEIEEEIDDLLIQIKLKKEIAKGQSALLGLYSSQLADIMDGKPLPKNPNAPEPAKEASQVAGETSESEPAGDWRNASTRELLDGIKGMGAKKLDAICELAPTVGALETLRGDASRAYKSFKEVLPKGCGEAMADEIENRLLESIKYGEGDEEGDEVATESSED